MKLLRPHGPVDAFPLAVPALLGSAVRSAYYRQEMTSKRVRAVLFDLDGTLLENDMDAFVPHYLEELGKYAEPRMAKREFLPALLASTRAMSEQSGSPDTNRDVFWRSFRQLTPFEPERDEAYFERFYREYFPRLRGLTKPKSIAPRLIELCQQAGWQVVIATNPLFPRLAIEERLRWANTPVERFPFALVTCYENMHTTKPDPAYYREILARIQCEPEEALMIGNDVSADIRPARAVGLSTFAVTDWLISKEVSSADTTDWLAPSGSLADTYQYLTTRA